MTGKTNLSRRTLPKNPKTAFSKSGNNVNRATTNAYVTTAHFQSICEIESSPNTVEYKIHTNEKAFTNVRFVIGFKITLLLNTYAIIAHS